MIPLLLLTVLLQGPAPPKNNPNGTWQSLSGTQFQIKVSGSDMTVRLVPGSNPTYVQYEVNLKIAEKDANSYLGKGFFVAKKNDKECRFETEWDMIVVSNQQIYGSSTNIEPDWETCSVKQKLAPATLDLKKK